MIISLLEFEKLFTIFKIKMVINEGFSSYFKNISNTVMNLAYY